MHASELKSLTRTDKIQKTWKFLSEFRPRARSKNEHSS